MTIYLHDTYYKLLLLSPVKFSFFININMIFIDFRDVSYVTAFNKQLFSEFLLEMSLLLLF